jgi:DNA helicase-2/ATP-dependent DNA helicase PcrA
MMDDKGYNPDDLKISNIDYFDNVKAINVYKTYQMRLITLNSTDFGDLLLHNLTIFSKHPDILNQYHSKILYFLVDEYQDTNTIQYLWLKLLADKTKNICCVGDDDQSIYGWRGAKIENIQRFQDDFPDFLMVRLEQNYRSTNTILGAANSLIMNNSDRLGKQLWTEDGQGDAISLYAAYNEIDEARYVVERIKQWFADGNGYSEAAILYRSNAQSRVLEEALLRSQMPYRIYGGQRFFENPGLGIGTIQNGSLTVTIAVRKPLFDALYDVTSFIDFIVGSIQ